MRPVLTFVVLATLAAPAAAQMVPPPMIEEPKLTAGVSATAWIPQSDAEDLADTSIGVRPFVTYAFLPYLAGIATFDFVFVNEDGGDDITYYNINVGARLKKPRPGQLEPYGELLLGFHQFETDGFDDSGIGFRFGGGILYPLSNRLVVNLGLNYSSVSIDVDIFEIDVDAFIVEGGLGTRF